jgi:gamma-glutamyltranspeptidase/glutathione hydrolase
MFPLPSRQRNSVLLLLALCVSSTGIHADDVYRHAVVAADHPVASMAGLEVIEQGGNVVDAAVATSFALSVVRPASCGIGGGGFMVIWNAETRQATALDYREVAPARATRDMFAHAATAESDSIRGGRAVAVPGTVAGLCFAARHHGTLPLRQLVAPAIRLATEGVPVDEHDRSVQAAVLSTMNQYPGYEQQFAALIRLYLNDGKPWMPGDRFYSPQRSILEAIAEQGARAFYQGPAADAICHEAAAARGIITLEDLAAYRPKVRSTVSGLFRHSEVHSMPPPSSGGVALIQILQSLEQWESRSGLTLNDLRHNSVDYIHVVSEAAKHAFADRAEFLGDPDFVSVPVETLLSEQNASETVKRIDRSRVQDHHNYGRFFSPDDSGTSHLSVIDNKGNAVACTETINLAFGSFVVVPHYGIVLNNEMDDFSAHPGEPNAFGLLQSEANAIAPAKKPLSSMSPTIVVRDGRAVLATGGSGGPRIISATLQVTLNHLVFGMTPRRAVGAPRFHHQWFPDKLFLEDAINSTTRSGLMQKGHKTALIGAAGVNQTVSRATDGLRGGSDPRKHGMPAGN